MELKQLNMGFVGMRMPGRELLRSRFQLGQTCSPRLGAAQTNCSQQVAAVIREGRGKEEKERISKQNPKHKLDSIEANQLCHAAQDACPHFDLCQAWVTEPPRLCQSRSTCGFTHSHLRLRLSPFNQPEKGLSDPALQHYLHFQGISPVSSEDGLQDITFTLASHKK